MNYGGGRYWPDEIMTELGEDILTFLESRLWLWPLGERAEGYSVLDDTRVGSEAAAALAAMPFMSEPEDAAVAEVLGTLAVVVAVM